MRSVPFDCGIIGDDHAESALDDANACYDPTGVNFFLAVELVASQRR